MRKSSALSSIAVILLSALVGVGVIEVGLRIAGFSFPRTGEYDPDRGSRRLGNVSWWHRSEGNAFVELNQEGYREDDHPIEKPAGVQRVAVLGDSQVEGWQVALQDRWTNLLEDQLVATLGSPVEVMNFGISGIGTSQEYILLRDDVLKYRPDLVILGFLSGNDVQNNSEALQKDPRRPYFVLQNGELVFDSSFREALAFRQKPMRRLAQRAIDRSRVLQVLFQAKSTWEGRKRQGEIRDEKTDTVFLEEAGLHSAVYLEPDDDAWRDAWAVTEAVLEKMNAALEASGARFLIVTLTNAAQIHPDASVRQEFLDHLGIDSLTYPDDRIAQTGMRLGIPVVNLAPRFLIRAESTGTYFHGFENTQWGRGHWNEAGHAYAAELVLPEAARLLESAP